MKITVAKNAGFCFGVKRATESLEAAIAERGEGERIYTLGTLIHNESYNEELARQGVGVTDMQSVAELAHTAVSQSPVRVFVRAHGIPKQDEEKLIALSRENRFFSYTDCTCPYVKKIHKIAEKHSAEENIFLLLGGADHPEVVGIMSYFEYEKYTFSSSEELEKLLEDGLLDKLNKKMPILAAQTTQKLAEWEKTQKLLKKVCTNPLIFDTICNVTEERQTEAATLARESDTMIVIGSRGSSNTMKLYEICKSACKNTFLLEDATTLLEVEVPRSNSISITAGASTPFSVIQEVKQTMSEQNFAELLEESMKTLNTGDIVTGVVTSISQNEITLDLGVKTTGVIVHEKLTDDSSAKLDEMFKIGDEVRAKVIRVSDVEGIAMLDKLRVDSEKNWLEIVAKCESGETVEGKIVECVKGGLIISINAVRVFIPAALSGVSREAGPEGLQALVGTVQKVKIIEIKEDRKRALASIRAVAREERKAKEEAFWAQVEIGQIYEGPVKSLTNYGAFVDLGGVDGMVHTTELSWRRIAHPSEVVKVGDVIKVYVKNLDREKGRISLGYKTEDMDPWNIFMSKYSVGDVASVKIVSLMPFGAFAEVVPGADGLIHISQIANHKIAAPADVLKVGDVVDAKVTAIDEENRKISLSIRALLAEEEAAEEEAVESVEEAADAE